MPNKTFNINTNVSGGAQQQNIGQEGGTANQVVTQTGAEPTVEAVLAEVAKALPEEEAAEVIPALRSFAALPVEKAEAPAEKGKILKMIDTLVKWQPAIQKNLMLFGTGALSAFASSNPILAGILKVCEANSNSTGSNSPSRRTDDDYDEEGGQDSWARGVVAE